MEPERFPAPEYRRYVRHNGLRRYLTNLPEYQNPGLPEWREAYGAPASRVTVNPNRLDYGVPILDQLQSNACGGFSLAEMLMMLHAMRSGGEVIELSPTYCYALCNHNQDQGSVLSDLLLAAKKFGCPPVSDWPAAHIFRGQGDAQAADAAAARFRLEEGYMLRNVAELAQANNMGKPCCMGIMVGDNFDQVDGEGISPPPQNIRGGHALAVDEVYVSTRKGVCLGGPNSWGTSFGRMGRYRVAVNDYLNGRFPFQAYALQGLVADPLVDGPHARPAA